MAGVFGKRGMHPACGRDSHRSKAPQPKEPAKGLPLLKEIQRDGGSTENEVWAGFFSDKPDPRWQAAAQHTSSRQPL